MKNTWVYVFLISLTVMFTNLQSVFAAPEEITIYSGQSPHNQNKGLRITAQNCKSDVYSSSEPFYKVYGQEMCNGVDADTGNWTCYQEANCQYNVYNQTVKLYSIPTGKMNVICGMPNTGDLNAAAAMAACRQISITDCVKNSQWSSFSEVKTESKKVFDQKTGNFK